MASRFLKMPFPSFISFELRNKIAIDKNGVNVATGGPENGIRNGTNVNWCTKWEEEYQKLRKPRIISASPEEIKFRVRAHPDLNASQIRMIVDTDNRFVLTSQYPKINYFQSLDLPEDANFEKAVFKAKFEHGWAHVTVTNFQKKEVVIKVNP